MRILLIEDDNYICEQFATRFGNNGCIVSVATDRENATLQVKLRLEQYDAVVVDSQIHISPGNQETVECGAELLNLAARSAWASGRSVRLVYWSTAAKPDDVVEDVLCYKNRILRTALPALEQFLLGGSPSTANFGIPGRLRRPMLAVHVFRAAAVDLLLPIHLSLQAFFGISRDVENSMWVAVDDGCEVEWRGGAYHKRNGTPVVGNPNAFLLVPEAEWDFYAEVGARLGQAVEAEKLSDDHEEWPFENLVAKLFDTCRDIATQQNLSADDFSQLAAVRQTAEDSLSDKEGYLKPLCGILASVTPGQEVNPLKRGEGLATHQMLIEQSKRVLNAYLSKELHTKWPEDIAGEGNRPDVSYRLLVQQLTDWNKDRESAKRVIAGIERLVECLNSAVRLLEKPA